MSGLTLPAPLVELRDSLLRSRRDLLSGSTARAVAVALLYPLDVAKARQQVTSAHSGRAVRAAVSRGGWFRGLGAGLVGVVPYGVLAWGVFGVVGGMLEERKPKWDGRVRVVLAACAADLVGSLWSVPAEVVKVKVQTGVYDGVWGAMRGCARGGIAGVWQGMPAMWMRDLPFRALQIVLYDRVRREFVARVRNGEELRTGDAVAVGAAVGAFVGAVTTPLDVVKTRLMSQRAGAGKVYRGLLECGVRTVQTEGAGALFRGLGPRALYMGASVALFSIGYEASRRFVDKNGIWESETATAPRKGNVRFASTAAPLRPRNPGYGGF